MECIKVIGAEETIYNLKKEIKDLENYYVEVSDKLHEIARLTQAKKKELANERLRNRINYKDKAYYVSYELLGANTKSLLLNDKEGNSIICINSALTPANRQKELHIMLKKKKCLTWYNKSK